MRAALASCLSSDGDISSNLGEIARYIGLAAAAGADLAVFGEACLQGFDALSWDWEADRKIALPRDGAPLREIARLSAATGVDALVGYYELDGEGVWSAAALFSGRRLLRNYRRVSPGWRVPDADAHYREGGDAGAFLYRGRLCKIALCGDLWTCPERFAGCELLLWPVYLSYTAEEWRRETPSYALQSYRAAPDALLVNPVSPLSAGGACHFREGKAAACLAPGAEGLLTVDL